MCWLRPSSDRSRSQICERGDTGSTEINEAMKAYLSTFTLERRELLKEKEPKGRRQGVTIVLSPMNREIEGGGEWSDEKLNDDDK